MLESALMLARSPSKQSGKQMPGNVGGGVGKKLTPSVINAVKASPAGMFPAAAAKAGITMGSKLGQAITKSPTGKIPAQMQAAKAGLTLAGRAMGGAAGGMVRKPKPKR
jgi:hypothetical protein